MTTLVFDDGSQMAGEDLRVSSLGSIYDGEWDGEPARFDLIAKTVYRRSPWEPVARIVEVLP